VPTLKAKGILWRADRKWPPSAKVGLTERFKFSFRAEAFNLLNHPLYGAPSTSITSATFGQLPRDQQNFPRIVQISAKFLF